MKTFVVTNETVVKKWYVVDAAGKPLGRLASEIAKVLRGKNKPIYTPWADTGDYVIVVNAEKVGLTGRKADQKVYRHHTLYPGGLKEVSFRQMIARKPEAVIELAVKGMLPKNSLGRALFRKLKVFKGPEHNHQAQMPEKLEFNL